MTLEDSIRLSAVETVGRWVNQLCAVGGRSVLGVCGLGGAGKSTTCLEAKRLAKCSCAAFEIDWYLVHSSKERRRLVLAAVESGGSELESWKYPISWYDWSLLTADLLALKETGKLERESLWNQSTGEKDLSIKIELDTPAVILCDGIYLLHQPIRGLLDAVILLDTSMDVSLTRSAKRDAHRNPEPYQSFKALVTECFDLPYFEGNRAAVDEVVF